jgi:AcrR family transcriptional regulator
LLQEGLALFDERGYAQATIEDLAARCGCSKGTVYAHFPGGKDELVQEIYANIGEEFDREFAAHLKTLGGDIFACVDAAAEVLANISAEPAKGRFFMLTAPSLPAVLGDKLGRTGRGIIREFVTRINRAQRAGQIDKSVDATHVAELIRGMLRELGVYVASGDASGEDLREALAAILRGALAGHPVS